MNESDFIYSLTIDQRKAYQTLIKEKQRDMRHKCAESVCAIPPEMFSGDETLISMNKAHSVVMNTVIE